MGKLAGKVAIVTGASKGIGAAIAKELGAAGAAVVVNYASDRSGAERVVGEIAAAGGRALAVQADVARADDVARLFEQARQEFGGVDVLVNNAGVYRFQALGDITEDEFHREFNINVLGVVLATREAARYFGPEGGSVINLGSVVSTTTPALSAVYTGSKAAVDAMTRVLAKELGPRNIRVNSLNPGGVETEGAHSAGIIGTEFQRNIVAQTPLGRFGQPADIAPVAVFLASDDSAWLTGEVLVASGGYR
ncbi:MAG TPA: glucose 1-dehydrogenase [Gemmatimonadales bacterium]|nr:glucose 1-dehydrogenase [Gemmatimonadales bacterium]